MVKRREFDKPKNSETISVEPRRVMVFLVACAVEVILKCVCVVWMSWMM